ncbi:MAG: hypothetical protein KL787_02975 [Taibaiella sp.]|nr:hypothetical protein [Taibaiella sp.]
MGIADAGDCILDSGVFIEAGSLNSTPSHEIESAGRCFYDLAIL